MNSTLFSMKRGYLRGVRFARKLLARYALTPARFDLLFTLRRGWKHQSAICKQLGLHPSTVSKLLKRLDDVLVFRHYDDDNRREVIVRLSNAGRAALEAAAAALVDNGALDAYMGWAVAGPNRLEAKRSVAVLNFEEALLRVRRALLDSARLLYLFEPEEHEDAVPPEWPHERAVIPRRARR
jgi:DNA-binding MarR family transcriptional regulator